MNKNNQQIYENEGVFGNEEQFTENPTRLEKMIKLAKEIEKPPRTILDIGCGIGFFADKLQDIFPKAQIYGIDISEKAVEIGKKKFKKIKFIVADVEAKLPYKSDYFELIISGEHIEHLADVDTYLLEIHRVLKKGGILILTTPNLGFWLNRILLLFGKQPFFLEPSLRKTLPIFSILGKNFPEDLSTLPAGHLRLYTLNMLLKLVKAYNFKLVKIESASILSKPFFKQIDDLLSKNPSLAFKIILKLKK